jgi:two-component system chemotaxis response regulator CheB
VKRVLIVEDSAVQREFLKFVLEDAGFDVVGTANDGEDGVAKAQALRPDVILMDAHMPKLDGIGATQRIMETCPTPIVIASASAAGNEAQLTFEALRSGALAVVNKRLADELTRTLTLMADVKVVRRWPGRAQPAPAVAPDGARGSVDVVAIVGSTGAPAAIGEILAGITASRPPPIVVVQHIAEGFVLGFAAWLRTRTRLDVQLATGGTLMQPATVYLAPDGAQLTIAADGRLSLDPDAAPEDGFRPSGTVLLRSVARSFGRRAIGIVLTGMGRDGVAGLEELRRAGGVTVAQDEASSVVFGMPREAASAARYVLPPEAIASLIVSYCG